MWPWTLIKLDHIIMFDQVCFGICEYSYHLLLSTWCTISKMSNNKGGLLSNNGASAAGVRKIKSSYSLRWRMGQCLSRATQYKKVISSRSFDDHPCCERASADLTSFSSVKRGNICRLFMYERTSVSKLFYFWSELKFSLFCSWSDCWVPSHHMSSLLSTCHC